MKYFSAINKPLIALVKDKNLLVLSLIATVILLLPLLVVALNTYPLFDDYWYIYLVQEQGLFQSQIWWLYNWFGRITSTFFISIFSQSIDQYFSAIIVNFLIYFFSFFVLCRYLFRNLSWVKFIPIYIFAFLISIYSMPDLGEGFFWMSGFGNYQLAHSFTLLSLFFILKTDHKQNYSSILIACVLLFLASTCNELISIILFLLAWFIGAQQLLEKRKIEPMLICTIIAVTLGFLLIVFAPGNAIRVSIPGYSLGNQDLIFSTKSGIVNTFEQTTEWLFNSPLLFWSFIYLVFIDKWIPKSALLKSIHPIYILLLIFGSILGCNAAVAWGTGTSGVALRHLNTIHFFFHLYWFWLLSNIAQSFHQSMQIKIKQKLAKSLLILGAIAAIVTLPNVFNIPRDFFGAQNLFTYSKQMEQRLSDFERIKAKTDPNRQSNNIENFSFFEEGKLVDSLQTDVILTTIPKAPFFSFHNEDSFCDNFLNSGVRVYYGISNIDGPHCPCDESNN